MATLFPSRLTQAIAVARKHPYAAIGLAFLVSRIVILLVVVFVQHIRPFMMSGGPGLPTGSLDFRDFDLGASLNQLGRADVAWYQTIVDRGYEVLPFENSRQHNWAFFPFWPLVWWLFSHVIPGQMVAGVLAAHAFLLLALFNVHRIAVAIGVSQKSALASVWLICFYPVSYFYSFPFTESLFLFLSTAFFYHCIGNRWIVAGLYGALASATRPTGMLLAIIPLVCLLSSAELRREKTRSIAICGLMSLSGLAVFMLHLRAVTGNALAFKDVQAAWGKESVFGGVTVYRYLKHLSLIVRGWDFRLLNLTAFLMCAALAVYLWRVSGQLSRPRWGRLLCLFMVLNLLMPTSTGDLQSLARFTLGIFPMFLALAMLVERREGLHASVLAGFALLLGVMASLYALGFTLASC